MSKLKITSENMIEIPIDERNPLTFDELESLTFDELESLTDEELETTRIINEQESTDSKIVIDVRFYRKN